MNELCPRFEKAVQIISKRWMGLILFQLLAGPQRFSDIEKVVHVSAKVLSERLKELEAEGILKRNVYPETPIRIEYELTEKGKSLSPVIKEIEKWSHKWL